MGTATCLGVTSRHRSELSSVVASCSAMNRFCFANNTENSPCIDDNFFHNSQPTYLSWRSAPLSSILGRPGELTPLPFSAIACTFPLPGLCSLASRPSPPAPVARPRSSALPMHPIAPPDQTIRYRVRTGSKLPSLGGLAVGDGVPLWLLYTQAVLVSPYLPLWQRTMGEAFSFACSHQAARNLCPPPIYSIYDWPSR